MSTPIGTTVLAFDFGQRRIGIAVGDLATSIASPLTTLCSNSGTQKWSDIGAIIDEWRPGTLIVGVPYNMDGSASALTDLALRFGRQLEGRFGLPVDTVDERLTSREAEAELKRQRRDGLKRRRTSKPDIDKIAARLILETWFVRAGSGN